MPGLAGQLTMMQGDAAMDFALGGNNQQNQVETMLK
jgi:hypothetical protein